VQAFGGPAVYQGLDMKAAHQGLNITESDSSFMERHAVAVLDKLASRDESARTSQCRRQFEERYRAGPQVSHGS